MIVNEVKVHIHFNPSEFLHVNLPQLVKILLLKIHPILEVPMR